MCASGKCDLTTGACLVKACEGTGANDSISAQRKACGATSNCGAGEVPDGDGFCRTPCQHDADCGVASTCSAGFCQAKPAVCNDGVGACALSCNSDVMCSSGFHCGEDGHCTKNCTANDQCPFGACDRESGRCTQPCPSVGCGLARVCTENVCYQSCTGDGARTCPEDRFCEASSGSCLLRCDAAGSPGCTGTQVCDPTEGQCIDRCPGHPCTTGVCDESAGLCVECLGDVDCTASGATCDMARHKCIVACDPANLSACTPPQTCCDSGPNANTCQDSCN
jgi:hypothetical protein